MSVHDYLLPTFCEIAAPADNEVTVYTTADSYAQIEGELDAATRRHCSWVRRSSDESLGRFFRRIEADSRRLDALCVLTPTGPGALPARFATLAPDCPLLAVVHNVGEYEPPSGLVGRVWPWMAAALEGRLPDRAFEMVFQRGKRGFHEAFVERLSAAVLYYPAVEANLTDKPWWDVDTHTLFPVIYRGGPETTGAARTSAPRRIVVPGRLHPGLREYDRLLDVVERLADTFQDRLSLHLLGRSIGAASEPILDRCARLQERGLHVWYHAGTDWIPDRQYQRLLEGADVVLAPLDDSIDGRVHTTGAIQDALRYGHPLVVPTTFEVADEINECVMQYETADDLAAVLDRIATDDEYMRSLQDAAHQVAARFHRDAQRERFHRIVSATVGDLA